ncbi:MAG: hypothetical protein KGL13_09270 [Gammaproteobacteria bacterium]|nr:hypothetical protein [Gammaproteobacteria bacterium]
MSGLNASQQRHVMAVFAEVSKHLDSIAALAEAKPAAQCGYPGDLSSEQRSGLRTLLGAMRRELTHVIEQLELAVPETAISAQWKAHTHLQFADVEFLELTAAKLRGYGPLDEAAYTRLQQSVSVLRARLRIVMQTI